jgi:hypothetical protein
VPIYEYQVQNPDGTGGARFEIEQPAADPPLDRHPLTGEPVRRVLSAPNLTGQHNERRVRAALNDTEKLARLGFTKYKRDPADGCYYPLGREP